MNHRPRAIGPECCTAVGIYVIGYARFKPSRLESIGEATRPSEEANQIQLSVGRAPHH